MRFVVALVAFVLVGAASPGPPARTAPANWTRTVVATPEGGFRIGNPAATAALIEYGSLTCSHCRDFHAESAALRRDYVAKGLVSFEYRSLVLNGPDVAVSMLARCNGPANFFRRVDAFYETQARWMAPFAKLTAADLKQLQQLPEVRRVMGFATLGKLDAYMQAAGMPRAQYEQCLTDPRLSDQLDRLAKSAAALGVQGTPTFVLNGVKLDTNVWPGVEAQLRRKLGLAGNAG